MSPARARNATILALLVTAICSGIGLYYYRAKLSANVIWDHKVSIEQETRLDSSIFEIGRKRGLIGSKKGPSGELLLEGPNCEGQILADAAIKGGNLSAEELRSYKTALRLLCNSPQGEEIRNEIETWNATYDLLAVRDNRFQDESCQSQREGLSAEVFVPRDCKPNAWKVERVLADNRVAASWIPGAEPPPADFSVVSDDDQKFGYAGDWAMLKSADPESGDRPRYRMNSETIDLSSTKEVVIDVVGRLRSVRVYEAGLREDEIAKVATHIVNPAKPETPITGIPLGPAQVGVFIFCGEESEFEANPREAAAKLARQQRAKQPRKPGAPKNAKDDLDDSDKDDECDAEPPAASRIPIAYQVTVAPPTGRNARNQTRKLIVELDAESIQILPAGLRRDYSTPEAKASKVQEIPLRLTRHIKATCPIDFRASDANGCKLSWERVPGARKSDPPKFDIATASRPAANLVDAKSGIIKSDAFDEGFGPIVGLGPQDWGSLVFALAHRPAPPDKSDPEPMRLTIDRDLQVIARDAVEDAVHAKCNPQPSMKKQRGRRAKPAGCILLRGDQTATLVVLDADRRPGEIKAVTSWPRLPKHLHIWDLQALESEGAGMAAGAWRLVAPDLRPGSTFKVVTAMTAIDLAIGPSAQLPGSQDKLVQLLSGKMARPDQKSFLRLTNAQWGAGAKPGTRKCSTNPSGSAETVNAIAVPNEQNPRWCAHNFSGSNGPAQYFPGKSCPPGQGKGDQFGMCEALMVSSNLFFGGVAEQITRRASTKGNVPLALETMTRRLSYDDQPCLDTKGEEIKQNGETKWCGFDLLRRMKDVRATKLIADPPQFDLEDYDEANEDGQKLLQSGWGDGTDATPLIMASIYASLGTGKLVRPTIREIPRRADGCPTSPEQDECGELLPDWNRAKGLFENLRLGLHAVTGPNGSTKAFSGADGLRLTPDGKPRLFGKTGTATYRAVNEATGKPQNFNSLWFAGWIDGVEGSRIGERIAFACVVTRGRGQSGETGGGVCAPLVRQFLDSLNKSGPKR